MENNITAELIEKAKGAASAKELLALAKENGIEMTEEEAAAYFETLNGNGELSDKTLNRSGELSDEELDNVSGGGCHDPSNGALRVTKGYCCQVWKCQCGSEETTFFQGGIGAARKGCRTCGKRASCGTCKFLRNEGAYGFTCKNWHNNAYPAYRAWNLDPEGSFE